MKYQLILSYIAKLPNIISFLCVCNSHLLYLKCPTNAFTNNVEFCRLQYFNSIQCSFRRFQLFFTKSHSSCSSSHNFLLVPSVFSYSLFKSSECLSCFKALMCVWYYTRASLGCFYLERVIQVACESGQAGGYGYRYICRLLSIRYQFETVKP